MSRPDDGGARRLGFWARVGNLPFVGLILLYRATLSALIGRQCRFEPTCSVYGLRAYRLYGPVRGTVLTVRRVLRCHPFTQGGYDPVPIPDDERGERCGHRGPKPHTHKKERDDHEPTSSRQEA